jgi:hypothetical protein
MRRCNRVKISMTITKNIGKKRNDNSSTCKRVFALEFNLGLTKNGDVTKIG